MEISILDFCEIFDIKWQPINLFMNKKTNKKDLHYCKCKDGYEYMPKPDDFTKNLLSDEELTKRQSYIDEFEYIAMDTTKYYQIDVDNKDFLDKTTHIQNICPYFLSSKKKLPHIIFDSKIKYNLQKVSTIFKFVENEVEKNAIEILSGLWSYVNKNEIIHNCKNIIPEFEINFVDIKHKKDKNTEVKFNTKQSDNIEVIEEITYDEEKYNLIKNLSACFYFSRLDNYDDWLNLMFAFKNELGELGYKLFDELSKKSKGYNEIENKKLWNNTEIRLKGKRKTLYHIKKWAREDNEAKYKTIIEDDNSDDFICFCEKDIAKYVVKNFLKKNFVCSDVKTRQFYYFNGLRWFEDTNNIKLYDIITEQLVNDYIDKKTFVEDNNKLKVIDKTICRLKGKICYFHNIVEHLSILIYDHTFKNKLDENVDLIGFDDCIYDLVGKQARNGKPEDYISKSVGYKFPTEYSDYKKEIDNFLLQVFPNQEIRDFVVRQQAQALSGRKGKDLIFNHCGIGGNGKSIEIDILKYVFGEYYCNIPIKMLTTQNNSGHNTPDPYFSKLKGIRYASSNEPSDGSKINDTFIKQIGSQEQQEYRLLFSNTINKLNLQLKLHIYCNDKLKLKGEDGGLGRRMVVINYKSRFDEKPDEKKHIYKIDYSLSDRVKKWRSDYIKMLIDKYDVNYEYSCPKEVEEASKQYVEDNNDVLKFVKEYLEFTNNDKDFVTLKDIKELYRNNKEYEQTKLKELKTLLERVMNVVIQERKKINGIIYRSVITGWKYVNDDHNDIEKF